MTNPLWYGIGVYLLAEVYKKFTTNQEKQNWEDKVKIHHGEAGVLMTIAGILDKSPALTLAGLGLAYHDRDDITKWFTGHKAHQYDPTIV